jgi:hypothetical protein
MFQSFPGQFGCTAVQNLLVRYGHSLSFIIVININIKGCVPALALPTLRLEVTIQVGLLLLSADKSVVDSPNNESESCQCPSLGYFNYNLLSRTLRWLRSLGAQIQSRRSSVNVQPVIADNAFFTLRPPASDVHFDHPQHPPPDPNSRVPGRWSIPQFHRSVF